MIRKLLLSLLILIAATSAVHAAEPAKPAEPTFSERKANLVEVSALRVGYGSGTVRIVVDMTRKVEYTESYAENPSRVIIDLKNTWLNPAAKREITLNSLAAKKIRVAQFDPTTVRIVIESMADIKPFNMSGGPKGHRFIIDVGNSKFKEDTDLNKPTPAPSTPDKPTVETPAPFTPTPAPEDPSIERERELQEQRERERELEKRERELEQQEREAKERQERERELEKRERELEQRERELKERQEREDKERQEREAKEQREREKALEKERKAKLEREIKEQREREKALEKERKEREKQERKEREKQERKEREKREKDKKSKSDDDGPEVDQPFEELDTDLSKLTALSGKKIVIDPGHGGNDAGAIGPTGVMEKNVTLKVALEAKSLLESEGATVIMTRDTDRTVSAKGAAASDIEELGARCEVANLVKADIFISIHADSFTRPEARGTTGYYYSKSSSGRGQKLADAIRRNLVEQLGTPSRGTQPCNFYVVKHTDMPATLIELGFISNKDEEKLLDSKEGVRKAAQAILDGVEDYFG